MESIAEDISSRLLCRVIQPSQYIGLEINARRPDVNAAEVTVAMAFPDTYAVGISHLGSQILYHLLNDIPGVACDRVYCLAPDAQTVARQQDVALFAWESRCRVRDFDIVGFALPYELCVTNVLTMLDLAGIPIRSQDRDETHPIIVGGDALADSPEPLADFIDVFLPGDGEEPLAALVERIRSAKPIRSRRQVLLDIARTVPSAYVPSLYRPRYRQDGSYAGLEPEAEDLPTEIQRACLRPLSRHAPPRAPLVPLAESVHDRVVVEVMRGCPNACRFCQAGATRLPVRTRSVEQIVEAVEAGLAATGYRDVSLLSLSTGDYPDLPGLLHRLNDQLAGRNVSISLPSLHVDQQLRDLPALTHAVRRTGMTIAAEAGTQRLREAIGKDIAEQDMLAAVQAAWQAGQNSVKVYFMAGLPGETLEDIDEIFHLCRRLSLSRKPIDNHKGSITASISWFVPKPHTPLQWAPMRQAEYFWQVRRRLIDLCRRTPVNVKFHFIERSCLEGVIARGNRRVGAVIQAAWENGATMDSWDEHFEYDRWQRAFQQTGVDPAEFAHRRFGPDEVLPWSHIRCFRSEQYLRDQYARAGTRAGDCGN
jgi:radical SAM family uncharacterized protein